MGMFLLLICFCLSGSTACKVKPVPALIPLDSAQIVGKVWDGALIWEPGFNQLTGNYLIVTKDLVYRFGVALRQIEELKLEINGAEVSTADARAAR